MSTRSIRCKDGSTTPWKIAHMALTHLMRIVDFYIVMDLCERDGATDDG
ncbi:MAG TPA: hypothetical protein PLD09_06225 [Methanomassiliicoccaceae archaeon]|nr:hypothetical protein [Methanomassiliicoccaceae archaeon]HOL07700.1 hypothetical protein [Methanomassiliicoccaceae archaeon]HQA21452.1 hypothetical protein [Methanomassiliicoccaceae archaeon]